MGCLGIRGGELWSRCGGRRSPVDHPLVRFRVAGPLRLDLYLVYLTELVGRQLEVGRSKVLLEPVQLGGAGDRHDPRLLREHPGEGDLRARRTLALGDPSEQFDESEVRLAGIAI